MNELHEKRHHLAFRSNQFYEKKSLGEKISEVRTLLIFESRASLPMLHFVVCFNAFMSSWELNKVKVLIKC